VPPQMKPMFEYLLQKLNDRIAEISSDSSDMETPEEVLQVEVVEEGVQQGEGVDEGGDGSEQGFLELNPQQLATANEFLANFEGKNLSDLHQINAALQGAMTTVPEDERIILEYVLQKLNVYIAELENN